MNDFYNNGPAISDDYRDYFEDHREEILQSAVDAIEPDYAGLNRENMLTLAGAMKNCGFNENDFKRVCSRSSQDKGTFAKQWKSFKGGGAHGEAGAGTIFQFALQSGWKWPAPEKDLTENKPRKKAANKPQLVTSTNEDFKIVCLLDNVGYKEKPPKSTIWDIRGREKVNGPLPEPIAITDFAKAITSGQTFYPVVYSKVIEDYNEDQKPIYKYRAVEQQVFVVDIDNEERPGVPIKNPLSTDEALEICKVHDIEPFFIYETFSSKAHREDPEKPYQKFRLCFALDKPLTVQEFGERGLLSVREWFIGLFGEAADTTTTDNGRLIFGTDEKDRAHLFNRIINSDRLVKHLDSQRRDPKESEHEKGTEHTPKILCVKDVEKKEIKYLIEPYIVRGNVTALVGDGGVGKTFVWVDFAAAITQGILPRIMGVPESFNKPGKENPNGTENKKVLYLTSEDGTDTILKERFERAGAFLENLFFVSLNDANFHNLTLDSKELETIIAEVRPALCVLDPLQSFVKGKMIDRNNMRRQTDCLTRLAAVYDVAFLIVVHTNKQQTSDPRVKLADSSDIWDKCRSVLFVGKTQNRERFFSQEKGNYTNGTDLNSTQIFKINDGRIEHILSTDKTYTDFFNEITFAKDTTVKDDAKEFILQELKAGEMLVKDLEEKASAYGIKSATFRRAKADLKERKEIKLRSSSAGYGKGTKWFISLYTSPDEQYEL